MEVLFYNLRVEPVVLMGVEFSRLTGEANRPERFNCERRGNVLQMNKLTVMHKGIRITVMSTQHEDNKWTAEAECDLPPPVGHQMFGRVPDKKYGSRAEAEEAALSQAKRFLDERPHLSQ